MDHMSRLRWIWRLYRSRWSGCLLNRLSSLGLLLSHMVRLSSRCLLRMRRSAYRSRSWCNNLIRSSL